MGGRGRQRRRRGVNPFAIFIIGLAAGWIGYWYLHRAPAKPIHRPAPVARASSPAPVAAIPAPTAAQTPAPSPEATTSSPSAATPKASPVRAPAAGEHRLAIIIDDCGQWPATERAIIAIGVPVTMSIMPDARYTTAIEHEAAAAGDGVMLHLPMEPIGPLDPGPGKITTGMSDAAIVAEVEADLAHVPLARGVNNHEGSKATQSTRVMRAVIGVLAKDDKFFIDSKTIGDSVGEQVAADAGVPTASRDVFLDNQANVAYVEAQLREAAEIARRRGSAIAIGHPRPATLAALREMLPQLQADGITLALAQDLVH